MIVKLIEGCIADVFEIDGVDVKHINDDKLLKIIKIILKKIETNALQDPRGELYNLINFIEYDYFQMDDEPCDQCGDTVTETIWHLEDK